MSNSWRCDGLPEIVASLVTRPGHEQLRTLLADILRNAFGATWTALDHEVRMPEVRGRADMLFGATVIELKSDLRRELDDVLAKLPDYLTDRKAKTKRRYLGIATDGATFVAFQRKGDRLAEIGRHEVVASQGGGDALLAWLEPALSDRDDLVPDSLRFRQELGRESLTFGRARESLDQLWADLHDHPEVRVKRDLWDGLLREAYGAAVGDDGLFLQHTYLTIVAKTLAARVLDLPTEDATGILSGRALVEAGIHGAVESDFFDWVLRHADGRDLVARIARQVARFRLRDVEADVLKALYESLIDPAQRHGLGEYYTPDWLAAKLVAEVVTDPLGQLLLDPACGSGTFLFHALRRLITWARAAGWSDARIVREAAARVRGLDVHPVAVIIARVTWLLALGEVIRERDGDMHVPVWLGDAMQWNLSRIGDVGEVMVPVPGEGPLHIPAGVAEDQARFEPVLRELTEGLERSDPPASVTAAMSRIPGIVPGDATMLVRTYERLLALKRADRNGVWPFVLRNLVRPIWLSRPDQRADVLIGYPPWVAYHYLSAEMKPRFKDACEAMDLWAGGKLATHQDLSALFWARGAERYLRQGGTIAFVLPYAAMTAPAFAGLRNGRFGSAEVHIVGGWSLEALRELFPNSSCALIGVREEADGVLPRQVERFTGDLPRRDASEAEADRVLSRGPAPWPSIREMAGASPYRELFRQGATIVPRRFFLTERDEAGRLGASRVAPRVRGNVGSMDKRPWNTVPPPSGPVEAAFLRPLLLGETVAPFRLLEPPMAVIPSVGAAILDSTTAAAAGHRHLAAWLRDIEVKWAAHANQGTDGKPRMTLTQQIDHMRKLSIQLKTETARVVYTGSGTRLSAAIVEDFRIVVEHKAYWAAVPDVEEARFLCALINSETVLAKVTPMQGRGWRDPRDFDKLVWQLPIPRFDGAIALHRELTAVGAEAETVAAAVPLPEGDYRRKRKAIRDALAAAGVAERLELLAGQLLAG